MRELRGLLISSAKRQRIFLLRSFSPPKKQREIEVLENQRVKEQLEQ